MIKIRKIGTLCIAALLLIGCDQPKSNSMSNWLGDSTKPSGTEPDDASYAVVVEGVDIRFPDDHQAHENFRHEWWYFTANLVDETGQTLGIQWTQFRFATAPQNDKSNDSNTPWHSQQIYMAHSAVTNQTRHFTDEKWSRQHPQLAGVEKHPLRVFVDDWQWQSQSDELLPAKLMVKSKLFSYTLNLTSTAPYQKQGNQGYSKKSADGKVASYYYSQPFIEVTGEVVIQGKRHQVSGNGWIDREWSSQFLLDSQQGWDWFALRLNNQTTLVVFQLRGEDKTQTHYAHARLMQSNGESISISPNDFSLSSTKQTNIQGTDYPTGWLLKIPKHKIDLTISALNPNAKMPLTVPYWEGPIVIEGTHSGSGYMELTGY
ncbi:lipocalin-like domain-containing protein [Vibrio fluminensis]|uniref:lipocalin-like domain-containing protein n=1 Tax=Vibrio fluminensis TaxID=2783614 RepID=UPI001888C6E9|nr:lipocalin-like domain-containing protein [Vibrio fluminensis]